MRIRILVFMAAMLAGLAGPLASETQAPAANPLDQLAWMIGGKWTADGENEGKPFHVEVQFHWAENHRGLKFVTWFLIDGKLTPEYEGLYAWHPAKKKFAFLYTDKDGELTEGDATWANDRLEQEFQIVAVDGAAHTFRSSVARTGPDDYDWNVQHQNKDGQWVAMFGLKYKRKPL
jgi:hypothetical protein